MAKWELGKKLTVEEAVSQFTLGIGADIYSALSRHINQKELSVQVNGHNGTELTGSLLVDPKEKIRAKVSFGTFRLPDNRLIFYVHVDHGQRTPGIEYYTGDENYASLRLSAPANKPAYTKLLTGIAHELPAPAGQ